MSQLGTASAEEKKEIMAKLRKLGEDMKVPASASTPAPAPAPAPPAEKQEDVDMETVDHDANKKDSGEGDGREESTEELRAKLAKLKEEVLVFFVLSVFIFC
jgi:RNA-binding protein 26